jgi:hypothetical protein
MQRRRRPERPVHHHLGVPHPGVDIAASVGAGDTELDTFLSAVGLAVIVGNGELDFKGRVATLRLGDSPALGALLFELASLIDAGCAAPGGAARRSRAARR